MPQLTGIRALAAMLVLGLHAEQNVPAGLQVILPFFARGYLGVDLFFVLSGFIITHVYITGLAQPSPAAIRIFLWHRFIRLYPAHVTVLAALVVLVLLAGVAGVPLNDPQAWQWRGLLWQLTLLHAWGVTETLGWNAPSWSISAEWLAYLLFPLLAPVLVRLRDRESALLMAAAALAGTAALFTAEGWSLNTWLGPPALTRVCGEFLCGAALCRVVALSAATRSWSGDLLGIGALTAFLVGASAGLQEFALVACLAVTVWGAATSEGWLMRWLGSPPLVWLGEISYSIYMVHFPVLIVIRRGWERWGFAGWHWAGKALALLATVAIVIALAAALFHLVERPARIRLRDRMGKLGLA